MIKFNPLVINSELTNSAYKTVYSKYIQDTFGLELRILAKNSYPFIFSCFVMSVDGKLNYQDSQNGYAITRTNLKASEEERLADWWYLNLGRAISDAVIVGTNSLLYEKFSYTATIDIPELARLREGLGKTKHLLHIIITRDLTKIDFAKEHICQANDIPVLIYCPYKPLIPYPNFIIKPLNELTPPFGPTGSLFPTTKQIIYDNGLLDIAKLIAQLHKTGIKTILNESPYYHHLLQQLQLLDEVWLNTSGVYIGGALTGLGKNNQSFTAAFHPYYSILTLHNIAYNFLYTRYKISYNT